MGRGSGYCMLTSQQVFTLDQVLMKPWSDLAHFWTLTHCLKKECPGRADIMDLTHFLGLFGPSKGSSRVL
jgi:hypothetical protein